LAPEELSDFAERNLVDRFSVLDGVADVFIGGQRRYAMRVWLDRRRMAAHQVTVTDIEQTLRANNIELPAGKVESSSRDFTVRADSRLSDVEEFRRLVVRRDGDHLIRLGDVAEVELGVENRDTVLRANGEVAIGLGIIRQSKANTVSVSDLVQAEIAKVQETLPADIRSRHQLRRVYFYSRINQGSADHPGHFGDAGHSGDLVFSWQPACHPDSGGDHSGVDNWCLYRAGAARLFLNVLTLLALILAIGLVVDDAIVMLENIQRRMDEGEKPLVAAFLGARQVAFAIIATTLTLVAVFVPISFMGGDVGRCSAEFGFTLAAAVVVSSVVALSLAPMLCSRWLKPHSKKDDPNWLDRQLGNAGGSIITAPCITP
jgi:multidrug efflux pump